MQELIYRHIDESCTDSMSAIWADWDVIRYTSIVEPCTREKIKCRIKKLMKLDVFVVIKDSDIIGIVGCPFVDREKLQFGLFYQLKKSVWGHGYATAAVKWMLDYMEKTYGKTTVFADVITANTASEKILINCGFNCLSEEEITHKGCSEIIRHYVL